MTGRCPKCKRNKKLTRHHVKPKRFFRRSETIRICRGCHDELELLIPREEIKPIKFYYRIVRDFIEGRHGNYAPY